MDIHEGHTKSQEKNLSVNVLLFLHIDAVSEAFWKR